MMSAYKAKLGQSNDKYYKIGYESFIKNLPRDIADDLVLLDRASFLKGWDTAKNDFLTKCPAAHKNKLKM